jgi:hypothetical protein
MFFVATRAQDRCASLERVPDARGRDAEAADHTVGVGLATEAIGAPGVHVAVRAPGFRNAGP